ncbi:MULTISPECIES: polymer-forming cytoskeletal protein [unclassified Janthinobacterium]|uniref:polymer-forming cytoskeletal protein n=1 Tax=unclassified Janthinobacterium TaxID=2610881 RepID=UPI0015877999|nr:MULTISPECIES: polymer-forming cytoskeletal protein [unclassified Janthinobacterium]
MRLLHILTALTLLLGSSLAHAATLNFNGGAVTGCTLVTPQYTCASLQMGDTDAVVIASGYGVTVNSDVSIGYNQGLSMSGTASLTANKNLDFSNTNTPNLKITGGSLTAKGGSFKVGGQSNNVIVADISAASVSLGGTPVRVTGNITATGNIDISSGSVLNGALSSSGGSISANSNVTISGSVKASGNVSIGSSSTITGPVSGNSVSTSSSVTITGDVTATNSFSLGSGSTLKGTTKAPVVSIDASNSQVQGDITASTSLVVGSGSQVKGNLTSPTIDLKASGLLVTGDVKASNTLTIASGNGVKGNVEGGNVTLDSSNAYITGNALVDHITLGWQGRVQQTITCKAYTPANPCSCVTNNSGWGFNEPQGPKCGPSTQGGPHHFQITHPPAALTCAAAPVTVTACADAACGSVYTGAVQVTLAPGGATAQINSTQPPTGMAASSVAQTTAAGNVPLGLTSTPATTGALVCRSSIDNSLTNCQMAFVASALQVSGLPRYAEEAGRIAISALQASPSNPRACVPLFASQSKTLQLSCTYANPNSGTLPARVQNRAGTYLPLAVNAGSACSPAGAQVQLDFDADGQATPNMLYADAGALNLTATYTSSSGSDSGLTMTGSGTVIVGPKYFTFSAIKTPQQAGVAVVPLALASNITVSALAADGKTVTRNFGRESPSPAVSLTPTVVAPTFDGVNKPAVTGSVVFNNGNGIGTASNLSWPETGMLRFTASTATYLDAASPALPATGSSDVVQYLPHHYLTQIIPRGTEDWLPPAAGATPCLKAMKCVGAAADGVYAYSGQPFGLRVTAQNMAGATTLNFDGRETSYMVPVQLQGWDAAKGKQLFPPEKPAGSRLTDGSSAQNTLTSIETKQFKQGVANVAIAYRFPGANGVPVQIGATDVLLRASSSYQGIDSTSEGSGNEGKLSILAGRLMVPHDYGSERYPVRLAVQVQYWDGSAWVANLADSISAFSKAQVLLANCKQALVCDPKMVADGTYTVDKGVLPPNKRLVLLAPGAGQVGSVDVSVPGFVHLPSTVGTVVFGVFKSGPVIYLREMY